MHGWFEQGMERFGLAISSRMLRQSYASSSHLSNELSKRNPPWLMGELMKFACGSISECCVKQVRHLETYFYGTKSIHSLLSFNRSTVNRLSRVHV